ncbi:MAG: DoxX family protein [Flavisolibacter sp.]|jgi:putative oxidoreductase|nr:DoxX family protein [Flavisolibacter sp.]
MKITTQKSGLAIIRIVTGLLMLYHGLELFDSAKMDEYLKWDVIKKLPVPEIMVYIGKGIELVGGIFFILGFLTRIAALFMAINMFFICFYVGNGKFYYEDQHPFVFGLLCLVFFFSGAGIWSLDEKMSLSQ